MTRPDEKGYKNHVKSNIKFRVNNPFLLEKLMPIFDDDNDTNVITKPKIRDDLKKPSMYTVVFFNDDYTPMEIVVHLMMEVMKLSREDATLSMMKVHKEGRANVGRYTFEIAEDKSYRCVGFARQNGHPLLVQPEEID